MSAADTPMVVAAARVLCKRMTDNCEIDYDDAWKTYSDDYLEDAKAALDAAGAPELLEALKACAGICAGESMSKSSLVRALEMARSAITKAAGATT